MSKEERTAAEKADFKRELTEVVPHLRAFARGLCGRPDMADDLVQETMLKGSTITSKSIGMLLKNTLIKP